MIITKKIDWIEDETEVHKFLGYIGDEHLFTITDIDSNNDYGLWFMPHAEAQGHYIGIVDDKDIEEISSKADSIGTYSLEYLNPVIKAVGSTAGLITCEFSSAKPLRIEFKVANIGRIHFYLAPRVES